MLNVYRSGFYAWLKQPCCYRNLTLDLKDDGESVGKNRVYRIMKEAKIKAIRSYKRNPSFGGGNVSHTAPS